MITPHYGYINRGAETFTKQVSNILIRRGHTVDIYGMGHGEHVRHVKGIRINEGIGKCWKSIVSKTYIEGFFKKFIGIEPSLSHWSYYLSLFRAFENRGYDFLWNNGELSGALFCYQARRKYGIPFVCTFHGNESMMMITEGLTKPDVYVVLTPKYKVFIEKKITGNIKCIPNGVELTLYGPHLPLLHRYDIDELERPIILSTSALLIPKKRLHLAIKAVSKMKRGTLVMTNTGPDEKKIVSMGHKFLGNRFLHLGVLPDGDLASLYAKCDVFTLPSIREPFGLVLLEAMASNKPVVSQNDKTRQWLVGDAGILVDCADIEKYANALEETSQRDWGLKPRKQAEKFSWDNCVDKYLQAMEQIS